MAQPSDTLARDAAAGLEAERMTGGEGVSIPRRAAPEPFGNRTRIEGTWTKSAGVGGKAWR